MEYIPSWSWLNWLCIYKVIVPIIVGQLRIATVKYLKYFDSFLLASTSLHQLC